MTTTTPSSVITTTESTVESRNHTSCGVVVAEKALVLGSTGQPDSGGSGEKALQDIQTQAEALGADAIVDVKINYEHLSIQNAVMMVSVSGNAVKMEKIVVR